MLLLLLFWGSGPLSPLYWIFNVDVMTSGVGMVKYRGRWLLMFFEPLFKHPWGFSNVFLITVHPITFISADDPTLLHDWIFIFWGHQEVLDGIASFKVDLHSKSAEYFLQALAKSSIIKHHHVWFLVLAVLASLSDTLKVYRAVNSLDHFRQ